MRILYTVLFVLTSVVLFKWMGTAAFSPMATGLFLLWVVLRFMVFPLYVWVSRMCYALYRMIHATDQGSYIVINEVGAGSGQMSMNKKVLDVFLPLDWVLWAGVCRDHVIAVHLVSESNKDVLDAVTNAFDAEPSFQKHRLCCFSHEKIAKSHAERGIRPWTETEQIIAENWWVRNQEETAKLFDAHPNLVAVFLEAGMTDSSRVSLVLMVRSTRYLLIDEPDYPISYDGMQVCLREGSCSLLGPALESTNGEYAPGYIGASIGVSSKHRNSQSGTLGAIVEWKGKQAGLTAGHCLKEFKDDTSFTFELTFPSERDAMYSMARLTSTSGVCIENDLCEFENVKMTIDAALVFATQEDHFYPFVPKSKYDDESKPVLHQSGRCIEHRLLLEKGELCFFGRTSGHVYGVKSLHNLTSKAHVSFVRQSNGVFSSKTHFNQSIFTPSASEGDSGSVIWKVTDPHSGELDACALVILCLFEGSVPMYTVATPIGAVLKYFGAKLQ